MNSACCSGSTCSVLSLRVPIYTNKILKIIEENYRVKTFEIDHKMNSAKPGQFIMIWIPGLGERPMSIGNSDPLTISVANVGEVTAKICSLKEGDKISYRGPFGTDFTIPKGAKRILVIGGGYGVVPLFFLSKLASESSVESTAIIGGRNVKDIIYEKQLFGLCKEVFITTDDGTHGKKGTVMAQAKWLIESKKFDCVYCCGPEGMMYCVADFCKKHSVRSQVSIERYMKCGVGICGSCAINDKLTCIDGPVMNGESALNLSEFGGKHRDATGKLKE